MSLKDLLTINFNRPRLSANELPTQLKKKKINEKIRFCNSRNNLLRSLIENYSEDDALLVARFFIVDIANILFLLNDMDCIDEPSQLEESVKRLPDKEIAKRFLSNDQLIDIINKKNIGIKELRSFYIYVKELFHFVEKEAIFYIKKELKTPVSAYKKKIIFQSIFYPCLIIVAFGFLLKSWAFINYQKYLFESEKLQVIENEYNYNNFIKTWLVLGDMPEQGGYEKSFYTDFLTENGGEKRILPKEGMAHHYKDGVTCKWTKYRSPTDLIDFLQIFNVKYNIAAYAFTSLDMPFSQKAILAIGSDDGVKVWLNGKLVHQNHILRAVTTDQDKIKIHLRKGRNTILVKVSQLGAEWGFTCRLFKITGITAF